MRTGGIARSGSLAVAAVACASLATPQSGGRFEETKSLGLTYLHRGEYDKAAGKLEEVWEMQKPPDPLVAESLAIAYLNGDDRKSEAGLDQQAFTLLEKAIAMGGQATLLVEHSHEKLGFIQGNELTKFCSGRLTVRPGKLTFVSEGGEHPGQDSFEFAADGLKEAAPNSDTARGMFHIKGRDSKGKERTYNMVPKSWAKTDSDFFLSLIHKNLQN